MFKWVGEIYPLKDYLWALNARDDILIDSLNNAKQYVIGVPRNDNQHQYLEGQGFMSPQNLHLTVSWPQSIRMLYAGRFDLIMGPPLPLRYNLKELGLDHSKLKRVYPLDRPPVPLYIAFSKKTSDSLVGEFQKAYQKITMNGTCDSILRKWLHQEK